MSIPYKISILMYDENMLFFIRIIHSLNENGRNSQSLTQLMSYYKFYYFIKILFLWHIIFLDKNHFISMISNITSLIYFICLHGYCVSSIILLKELSICNYCSNNLRSSNLVKYISIYFITKFQIHYIRKFIRKWFILLVSC